MTIHESLVSFMILLPGKRGVDEHVLGRDFAMIYLLEREPFPCTC